MQSVTYLDIETGPLPEAELVAQMPEFEAARNLKDPEKIAADIAEKKRRWIEEAALSAISGQILCAGTLRGSAFMLWDAPEFRGEDQLLIDLWGFMSGELQCGNTIAGFCIKSFDIPYMVRRSFKHGIKVPACIWQGRFLTDQIVDIADLWSCGSRDPRDRISLDALARFLGVGQKTGTGADFAQLWVSDRQKAIAYLENDLKLTALAYERMVRV